MIKKIIVFVSLLLPFLSKGQVTVSVQLPPAGMIQKDQLWNLVVINNNSEVNETTITLDLQDAVTGQTVLSAGSRSFVLGKGIKVISARDVQPVQYNYLTSELTGVYIPLGSYVACYRVARKGIKGPEPLGDECVRLNINPLSPPLLNTPFDKTVLQTTYPQFSWLPPSPADMFSNLNYDLAVAEVLPGQSAAEAILYNTPVYTNHNLKIPYENYPSTFSKLKEGRQYAWQVTARNGFNYAAQTEVWSFVIQPPDTVKTNISGSGYILLKNNNNSGVSYISNNELLIKYYSFDTEHEAIVRFHTADGKLVQEMKQKILYGDNFLQFKLSNQFNKGSVYSIEITDQQRNKYITQFSIR
jgi:hypothetical protein